VYDVTRFNMMLQRYSNIRNTILYGLRQIAVNQAEKLFHRIITDPENRRGFNEQNTLYLANALNNASPTVKAYYFEFLGLVMREFFSAKVGAFKSASREEGGYADLWRMSNTQKIITQRVIYGLELTQFNKAKKLLHFTFTQPIEHAFREGDLALIYLDKEFTSPSNTGGAVLKQQFLKGAIKHINSTEIYFSLRSELVPDSLLANKIGWCIEPDQMDGNTWSTVSTLTNFLSAPASVQQVILGVTPPKPPATKEYLFPEQKRLLPHQKQVITAATNANNYYLLQGPPGTGKTLLAKDYKQKGAHVKGINGNTPLHIATTGTNRELISFLIENGANIDSKNNNGDTPLHLLKVTEYVYMFKKHMAEKDEMKKRIEELEAELKEAKEAKKTKKS
jgi:hypothetical protein